MADSGTECRVCDAPKQDKAKGVNRYGIGAEIAILFFLAAASGILGWKYIASIDDADVLRDTRNLANPVLSGAIHFAIGRGMGIVQEEEEGFPELKAFLNSEITEIPREAWPRECSFTKGGVHYFYMTYYLIAYLGWVFRLFGISVWSFRIACLLLYVAYILVLYGIFRLVMGRLLSLPLVLFLSFSQSNLCMITQIRDFGKAPFILGALLLLCAMLKRPLAPRRLFLGAILCGGVIGLGYGFRQDVFACLPLAVVCVFFFSRPVGKRPWRTRITAVIALLVIFGIFGMPVFKGDREVGGTITIHTLFQGLMVCAESNADYESSSYDFGFLNYDHPIVAAIRSYAKRIEGVSPVYNLTPLYGEVGKRMFREVVLTWPADLAGRVVAVMDSLFGILATPFIWPEEHSAPSLDGPVLAKPYLRYQQIAVGHFCKMYGLPIMLIGLALLGARNRETAFLILVFLGYFSAFTSLLFEYRHYFYLSFIPLFFLGMLVTLICEESGALRLKHGKPIRNRLWAIFKAGVGVALCALCVLIVLSGLRIYQNWLWESLLTRYETSSCSALPLTETQTGDTIQLLLPGNLTELAGRSQPSDGEVASFYLAARFRGGDRTVSFRLINNNPVLSRTSTIVLRGEGVYFFPVYDFPHDTPFIFKGIELEYADRPLFEGLYLYTNADSQHLWPYVFVPENRQDFVYYKTGRIDRWLSGLFAETKGGFGLWPDKALDAYLDLIPRYPLCLPFADRALELAQRCADARRLEETWDIIGVFMPVMRSKSADWMVEKAEHALAKTDIESAARFYEKAYRIYPTNVQYLEKVGNLREEQGKTTSAEKIYEEVMRRQPENYAVAGRLQAEYEKGKRGEEAMAFWKELSTIHPQASVPLFYFGVALEGRASAREAVEVYGRIPQEAPLYWESQYRQGFLLIRQGTYEEGMSRLLDLQERHPEFAERMANDVNEAVLKLMEERNYDAARIVYEMALKKMPDNPVMGMNLGMVYELAGETAKAKSLYEDLLTENPDTDTIAERLDGLYARECVDTAPEGEDAQGGHVVHFWRSLASVHPESPIPWLYLGTAYERVGNLEEAFDAYQKVLAVKPGFPQASYRLGMLYVERGETDRGIAMIRATVAENAFLTSEISRRCAELAEYCVNHERSDTALKLYEIALGLSPEDVWLRVRQGEIYEHLGEDEAALDIYRNVLIKQPETEGAALRMDHVLQRMRMDSERVLAEWEKIIESNPDSSIPYLYYGINLELSGALEQAESAYRKTLQKNPKNGSALYRLGALKISRGELEAGLEMIKDAVANSPDLSGEISLRCDALAASCVERKRYEEAGRLYDMALTVSPNDLWPRVHQGELYEKTGDNEAALACYRTVLMSVPNSPVTAKRMQQLLRTMMTDNKAIVREWNALVERYPSAAIPALYWGMALEASEDLNGARAAYRQALQNDSTLSEAKERLDRLNDRGEP